MGKLVETIARAIREAPLRAMGHGHHIDPDVPLTDTDINRAKAVLAAMCEGEALAAMVERASKACTQHADDHDERYVGEHMIEIAIRAALTVQP